MLNQIQMEMTNIAIKVNENAQCEDVEYEYN